MPAGALDPGPVLARKITLRYSRSCVSLLSLTKRSARTAHLALARFWIRQVRLAEANILTVEWSGDHLILRIDGEEEGVLVHCAPASLVVVLDLAVLDHESVMPAQLFLRAPRGEGRLL